MRAIGIHRVVEQQAAARGASPAVIDTQRILTYRELNYAANVVARYLVAHGFRRGAHAFVRMPRSGELAIVLLAVLKTGGSYTWSDAERTASSLPDGVSIAVAGCGRETRYLHLDVTRVLAEPITCSPNLPVVTRATDVACVLEEDGAPAALVPHATITALAAKAVPQPTPWVGEAGAFDLWMALMAGTTAIVEEQAAVVTAA